MYYFAYASNLNRKQLKERCPDARPLFTATLPNFKLVFTGWSRQWRGGYANLRASRGDKVRGALYEVSDLCLRRLDKFEAGYTHLNVTVFDEDNEPHEAVTYINAAQRDDSLPSKEYAAVIRQGYKDWHIG